jgi:hypothetical protein
MNELALRVVRGCVHDGEGRYLPGDVFKASLDDAVRLVDLGVCVEVEQEAIKLEPVPPAPAPESDKMTTIAPVRPVPRTNPGGGKKR